jgi:hypothetical protein
MIKFNCVIEMGKGQVEISCLEFLRPTAEVIHRQAPVRLRLTRGDVQQQASEQ